MQFRSVILLLMVVAKATGYPDGAPGTSANSGVCMDLMPTGHPGSGQTSASPYTITVNPSTFTAGGSPIQVTISGTTTFMGFLLTTQYANTTVDQTLKPGTFNTVANTKLTCQNQAVTQTQRLSSVNTLTFSWTPPATALNSHVTVRLTVVQSKPTYWVDIKKVILNSASTATVPPVGVATTAAPATGAGSTLISSVSPTSGGSVTTAVPTITTGTSPSVRVTSTGSLTKDSACGKTKGCFSDCSGTDCSYLVTWEDVPTDATRVKITMKGKVSSNSQYISFGLSTDTKMASDSVNYCIGQANGVYAAYNVAGSKSSRQLSDPKSGITSVTVDLTNGILTCTFYREMAADVSGERFALDKVYNILWATGPGSQYSLSKHNQVPVVSAQSASLTDYKADITGGAINILVKAHGSLMLMAWVFAASIGLIFARYFKNVFEDNTWFGQKIWFQVHRGCMVLVFLLTAIAFIIIFVEVDGYSDISGEGYKIAHPILGIIVMALTLINPIMSVFRCHPGTPHRPIFNWAHWGVGTTAYILGIITIFFGFTLDDAQAPDYAIYVMAAFVAWQAFITLLLEIINCIGRSSGRRDEYEMTDVNGDGKATERKPSTFPKVVLGFIHIAVVAGFVIALIIILNVGENGGDD